MASVEEVRKLINRRDELERQISEQRAILMQNNIGMDEPLVDADDFPRSDIDITAVRKARGIIRMLENDLQSLMKDIENGICSIHQTARQLEASDCATTTTTTTTTTDSVSLQHSNDPPFLVVQEIAVNSPAQRAGLMENDKIIQFGSLKAANFVNVRQVGELVRSCLNEEISVTVLRSGELLSLELKPLVWSGTGLLGCRVVPVDR